MKILAVNTDWSLVGSSFITAFNRAGERFAWHFLRFIKEESVRDNEGFIVTPLVESQATQALSKYFSERVSSYLLESVDWDKTTKEEVQKVIDAQKRAGVRFAHFICTWSETHHE